MFFEAWANSFHTGVAGMKGFLRNHVVALLEQATCDTHRMSWLQQ